MEARPRSQSRLQVRYEIEREVIAYAVVLLVQIDGWTRPVVLFDCSHGDRNDRHRYTFDGVKRRAEVFHHGTPAEAMRAAVDLIERDFERMIERWRA